MKQYVLEIIRQKWRYLSIILFLMLLNVVFGIFVSMYQVPSLMDLQSKWSALRSQNARTGRVDAATLYQQGAADLDKLKSRIPARREFARVLSDLYESAASSAVEINALNYKSVQIKEQQLLTYQLTLSVGGNYAAVKSFLADLINNQELIVIDSVSFSNSDLYIENVVMDLHLTVYLREGV